MESMNLRRITEAQNLEEVIEKAEMVVNEALKPEFVDFNQLPLVYDAFLKYVGSNTDALDVSKRRTFLFVAAYLFCPSALIGKKMPSGMRQKILDTMHLGAGSIISRYMNDLMFWYEHYKGFREDVNSAYVYIREEMLRVQVG